jgi:hypothetical protein
VNRAEERRYCPKLIGYGRLEGFTATAALRRVYEASRQYTNFFQLSFKLKSKYGEGARVHKQYELPDTPYRRLLVREDVPLTIKEKHSAGGYQER